MGTPTYDINEATVAAVLKCQATGTSKLATLKLTVADAGLGLRLEWLSLLSSSSVPDLEKLLSMPSAVMRVDHLTLMITQVQAV